MTGPEVTDFLIKYLAGTGVRTDEMQNLRSDFVDKIRDAARGQIVNMQYLKSGTVAPIFYQETYCHESDWIQEKDCVYRFPAPAPLTNPEGWPWVQWIGGSDWTCEANFRFAKSRQGLIYANNHHIIGRKSLVRAYYDNSMNCWWIYRNEATKDFAISQVCINPYEIKEYNIDKDNYPFPNDQMNLLTEIVNKLFFRYLREPADMVPNSRNDNQQVVRR